jgi:CheY-like chemotaxis protein
MNKTSYFLVDDDGDDSQMFCEAFNAIDPSIICYSAEDGKMALQKLNDLDTVLPKVIFLDINLPGINGWDCLIMIRSTDRLKTIPIAIYSTSNQHSDAMKAFRLGADCFITKPNRFQDLQTLLTDIHEQPATDLFGKSKLNPHVKVNVN